MNQTNLNTLASRVEDASGPDEQLDFDIAEALELQPTGWASRKGKCSTMWPRVTASLDAALTLVPDGWSVDLWAPGLFHGKPHARLKHPERNPFGEGEAMRGSAATPALALCAAALRARAANG